MRPLASSLLPLLLGALVVLCQGKEEDTPVDQLAWHDGMLFFNGAIHKTVPPNATASGLAVASQAVPCPCTDGDPRDESTLLVTVDCFYQAYYNTCNASFMSTFLQELLGHDGFCQISCGRCPCCISPADLLQKLNATRFLQALTAAQPSMMDLFKHPGFMNTILVPTNDAFDAALNANGALLEDPALLQQVLKFHILPPEPARRGLWTTPFMATGAKLYTAYDGPATLSSKAMPLPPGVTAYGGLAGLTIQGPSNAATILQGDIMSCKSYINIIDTVLLPFNASAWVAAAPAAPSLGSALGVPTTCSVQANGFINGTSVGSPGHQKTAAGCCASCQSTPGCNAWQYCSQKGGCKLPDGTAFQFGYCQLKHSPEVASGQPPAYGDFGPMTVPFLAGYLGSGAPTVAAASGPAGK